MRNPKKRYETSLGIAFDEAGDLQRLGDWAAEGWRLTGFRGLKYVLEPAPAEQVVFAVDYLYEPDAEYFELCRASGWEHVISMDGLIHLFKAVPGTPAMFSTAEMHTKYRRAQRQLFAPAVGSLVTLVAVWLAIIVWGIPWRNQLEPEWVALIGTYGLLAIVIAAQTWCIFTVLPWLAYRLREWRGVGQVVVSVSPIALALVTVLLFLWLVP
jgi:hypothetical protein